MYFGKVFGSHLIKLNTCWLPYGSAVPLLGIYPGTKKNIHKKDLLGNVHSKIIHNSQTPEIKVYQLVIGYANIYKYIMGIVLRNKEK